MELQIKFHLNNHSIKKSTLVIIAISIIFLASSLVFILTQNQSNSAPEKKGQERNLVKVLESCGSIPNGTTMEVSETSRLFINLPEGIYPYEARQFTNNGASAGLVSNGEEVDPVHFYDLNKPVEPFTEKETEAFYEEGCKTHLYEFVGNGTVEMGVESILPEFDDYWVGFKVNGKKALEFEG